MSNNYFAIECNKECVDDIAFYDKDRNLIFEDVLDMTYDDIIKNDDYIQSFVATVMETTNKYFENASEPIIITLIGPDDVFIWSIVMGPDEEDQDSIRYSFINWQEGNDRYRYEKNIEEEK